MLLLQGLCQRLQECCHFGILQELHQQRCIVAIGFCGGSRCRLRGGLSARAERRFQSLCVQSAVIVDDMGVDVSDHLDLCVTGVTLDGLHIAAVELQLVGDAGVPQAMENYFWQSVLLNQLIESSVDDLILNGLIPAAVMRYTTAAGRP